MRRLAILAITTLSLSACAELDPPLSRTTPAPHDQGARDMGARDMGAHTPHDMLAPDLSAPPNNDDMRPYIPPPPPVCEEGATLCGRECVQIARDPDHCGGCGRTCVIPHAEATCQAGECAILSCEDGYFDRDGDVTNGCENQDSCQDGAACQSSCQSEGSVTCVDGEAMCVPPEEVCDGVDNNCDGGCDEGAMAGCRRGIHRAYGNGHIFTSDLTQASNAPYSLERQDFFHLYQVAPGQGRFLPVFLCKKPSGKYQLSIHTNCDPARPRAPERELGFWAAEAFCGSTPLYHVYSAASENDFYTLSAQERDNAVNNLGYTDRGVAGHVWTSP